MTFYLVLKVYNYSAGENMIIYLDLLITLNFIINFVFLRLIYIIQNKKENYIRIILSSVFSILLLLSFLLNYKIYNIIKLFGGLMIILIGLKIDSKKNFIISSILFYFMQFSFIGILKIFNIKGCFCLFVLLLVCLMTLIILRNKMVKMNYNVFIKLNNKELILEGYLDTGNNANYYNKPIIFIDKKYYDNTLKVIGVVNIKTINGSEFINCYYPEEFYIIENNNKIPKNVLIAFSDFDNKIQCLLNNMLFM